jgi:hypothetical protein
MTISAVETIRELQLLGRTLTSDGRQLSVSDGSEISPALMESMREHRDTLIRIFTLPEAVAERQAIQWAERRPNPEADDALAAAGAEWVAPEASAFLTAAAKAFPGSRMRPLGQAEYDEIGFRDSRDKQAAEAELPHVLTPRRGEWLALASGFELQIGGEPTALNAGEGVQRIVSFDEIGDSFSREGIKRASAIYEPRGMVAVWVRGVHPTFLEPELIGIAAATSPEEHS